MKYIDINTKIVKYEAMRTHVSALVISLFIAASASAAVVITTGTYTQNFNGIGTALPDGWQVYAGATATSSGTAATFVTAATGWGSSSPQFRNSASTTGLTSASGLSAQNASPDRAVGLSQGSAFGNPGGAFAFNFSTLGVSITSLSFDALMLRVGDASSTWSIQYGIGAAPASWTTFGTYADPGVWGSTPLSYDTADFGSTLDNQANVWFRFVSLSAATGTAYDTIGIDNFALTAVTGVPEPATSSMLTGAGVALLVLCRRKGRFVW